MIHMCTLCRRVRRDPNDIDDALLFSMAALRPAVCGSSAIQKQYQSMSLRTFLWTVAPAANFEASVSAIDERPTPRTCYGNEQVDRTVFLSLRGWTDPSSSFAHAATWKTGPTITCHELYSYEEPRKSSKRSVYVAPSWCEVYKLLLQVFVNVARVYNSGGVQNGRSSEERVERRSPVVCWIRSVLFRRLHDFVLLLDGHDCHEVVSNAGWSSGKVHGMDPFAVKINHVFF